ncbi:MAG: thioredoxin domain-containing protein [bacterium]
MAGINEPYTNRLIHEKSPYLLQHAHNPVDWYPWSDEAFQKAGKEDKPIFLSIGYSTCHWCHVMERESFSDPEIARLLNTYFVPIKVDREERPDIDSFYMNAVTAILDSGGWPLNVFLTPARKPFWGGTYFPPEDRPGIFGLKTLLAAIAHEWENNRMELLNSSESIIQALIERQKAERGEAVPLSGKELDLAYQSLSSRFDRRFGGFGTAPKFPRPHLLSFLLRYWKRTAEDRALQMVEQTLTRMAGGGIYDQIGGGFHRYATDAEWQVPHYEKMLYDQALASKAYLEAYQATGRKTYAQTAREIFEYVLRSLTGPEGGFYSGEDADSAPDPSHPEEKREGAFYLFSKDEVMAALGRERGEMISFFFGLQAQGVTHLGLHEECMGKGIPFVAHSIPDTAQRFNRSEDEIEAMVQESRKILLEVRSMRPKPFLDDMILVDWNGLMISSLSLGSRVLGELRYQERAEKAAQFILQNLMDRSGRLLHRYRDKEPAISGMLPDYAFFINGLLDLYEASFHPRYLGQARHLCEQMIDLFRDEQGGGGLLFAAGDREQMPLPQKEAYDGVIPSGNSLAAFDLLRLARLTMDRSLEEKADLLFGAFSKEISQAPDSYAQMLMALDFAKGPSREIVLSAGYDNRELADMVKIIFQGLIPNRVIAFRPPSGRGLEETLALMPHLENRPPLEGRATAYVCEHYTCHPPVKSAIELREVLKGW